MKWFKIIFAVIGSKLVREVVKASVDMIKKIIAEIKTAKLETSSGGEKIVKEEKKQILKTGLSEFKDVLESLVENL